MQSIPTVVPRKRPVLGVGISPTSYVEVARVCRDWVAERRRWRSGEEASAPPGRYICVTSVHGVISAVLDSRLKSVFNAADMAAPDGMPVVWALRSFGEKAQERVYGPDLMLALCADAERQGHRLYFYGGHDDILRNLLQRLRAKFPNLAIAGEHSPPFRPLTPEEDEQCVRAILDSDADIVFLGLSTPKQDRWMNEHRGRLPGVVMAGVGAAFDFHAGRVRQAPLWMRRSGLEWSFRLLMEPARLWKRYLLVTPLFLPLWGLQKLGVLKYPAIPGER
jgi:N-acetylglucosaminyldiphosphoundecaprenol N-acetyl-beta-D-mannosaminyltransferase